MPLPVIIHLDSTATAANKKRVHPVDDTNDITTNKKPRVDGVEKALEEYRAAINERPKEEADLRAQQAIEMGKLQTQQSEQTNSLQAQQMQGMPNLEGLYAKQLSDLLLHQHQKMVIWHEKFMIQPTTDPWPTAHARKILAWRERENGRLRQLIIAQEEEPRQFSERLASLLGEQEQEMNSLNNDHKKALNSLQEAQARRVVTTKAALDHVLGRVPALVATPSAIKLEDPTELDSIVSARPQQANVPAKRLGDNMEQRDQDVDHPVFKHIVGRLLRTPEGQIPNAELLKDIGKFFTFLEQHNSRKSMLGLISGQYNKRCVFSHISDEEKGWSWDSVHDPAREFACKHCVRDGHPCIRVDHLRPAAGQCLSWEGTKVTILKVKGTDGYSFSADYDPKPKAKKV